MIWKTTLTKIFLPLENVKDYFHQNSPGKNFQASFKLSLTAGFWVLASFFTVAQTTSGTVTGDDCNDAPSAPEVTVDQPTCSNPEGTLVISTTAGLQYSIDGTTFSSDGKFEGLAPGDYQVLAKDQQGCISDPATVTINPQPATPAAPEVSVIIQPTCEEPTGSFGICYATGMEYSIDGSTFTPTPVFTKLDPGVYQVVARNEEGCVSPSTEVTIDPQPETPAAPAIVSTEQPTCKKAAGSVTVAVEDGFSYSIDGSNYTTSGTFTDLEPATTYQVTTMSPEGCVSESTSVTIEPQPKTPAAPIVSVVVQPSCDEPTGSFGICCATGMEYSIDGSTFTSTPIFTNLEPGVYEVVARNKEGCISAPTEVIIDPQPETPAAPVVISTQQPNCEVPGGSFTVAVEEGLSYSIDGSNYSTAGTFTDLEPGTYEVTATSEKGCVSESTSVTIDPQPITPAAPVIASIQQPTCETPSGSFTVTAKEDLTYSIDGTNFSASGTFADLQPEATYQVWAKSSGGCISEPTEVTIEAQPQSPPAPVVEELLQPSCEEPTGVISLTYIDDISYTLTDQQGSTTQDEDGDGVFIDVAPGEYTVTSSTSEGCISDPVTVTLESPGLSEIQARNTTLCVEDVPLELSDLLTGESTPTGTWEDPANTGALSDGTLDPSVLGIGTYTFNYVRTMGDCTDSTSVDISINDDCVVLACGIEDVKESISKAVTPNGDAINDYFTIGLDLDCGFVYNVKIFNRWGNMVFSAKDYQNNWSGTTSEAVAGSNQLPSGTYYYVVEIAGLDPIQGYIFLGTK